MEHLDLFSGIGGFALAAKWAGFDTVAFCEIEPYCQKVLRKNFGDGIVIHDDIRQLDGTQYRGIDLITGGFPCQPYSIAGKRRGDDDPRALWPEMRRVIHEAKPTWVVGENVAHFANMGLDAACADLENEGYEVQPFIIPAVAIGAPHQRKRVFIVAHSEHSEWRKGNSRKRRMARHVCCVQEGRKKDSSWPRVSSKNVPNTRCEGCKRRRIQSGQTAMGEIPHNGSGNGGEITGLWWATEPAVGRVANGIPNRVDRIRALGNAVVPQQVYPILRLIVEYSQRSYSENRL